VHERRITRHNKTNKESCAATPGNTKLWIILNSGSRLVETRRRLRMWEVALHNLLLSALASHVITHNGNICRPLAQTAKHIAENGRSVSTYRRKRFVLMVGKCWQTYRSKRSVGQSYIKLARYPTRKRSPYKTQRGRKYTRKNANRKTHSAQGVTVISRDTHIRSVNMWTTGVKGGGAEGGTAPQKIWIGENLGKIPWNPGKCEEIWAKNVPTNLRKIAECAFILQKWHPKWKWRVFFGDHFLSIFFRQVCGSLGKNFSHPQKFACSYTYDVNGLCLAGWLNKQSITMR